MQLQWSACAEQDLPVLLAFMEAFAAGEGTPFNRERYRQNVLYLLAHPAFGGVWLIRAGGRDVGYVVVTLGYSFEFGGHDSFVDELYVVPAERAQGIGSRSLAFAEHAARALGARWLHLEASRRRTGLGGFYEKSGYTDRGYRLLSKPLAGDVAGS